MTMSLGRSVASDELSLRVSLDWEKLRFSCRSPNTGPRAALIGDWRCHRVGCVTVVRVSRG